MKKLKETTKDKYFVAFIIIFFVTLISILVTLGLKDEVKANTFTHFGDYEIEYIGKYSIHATDVNTRGGGVDLYFLVFKKLESEKTEDLVRLTVSEDLYSNPEPFNGTTVQKLYTSESLGLHIKYSDVYLRLLAYTPDNVLVDTGIRDMSFVDEKYAPIHNK